MNPFELGWLPDAPADFRARLRCLRESGAASMEDLRKLAITRLDLTQLHALSQLLGRLKTIDDTAWSKVAILSNASTEMVTSALPATALRHHLPLRVSTPSFGLFAQEAIDPTSETNTEGNDFVVLALDHRAFDFQPMFGDQAGAHRRLDDALTTWRSLVDSVRTNSGATVVVQTIAAPSSAYFGNLEAQVVGTVRWFVEKFNERLYADRLPGTLLFDLASLAASVGAGNWHDPVQWALGKFPFAHRAVPLYAEHLARVLMAAKGKSRKCLVLDLDNTLWGGVIGDDGLSGIVLGQGSPVGEAYQSIQAMALRLRARGIVLAVCSKNDEAVARSAFREHPEMLLREEHIAVFQANWNDKASNLRAIAESLNLGIDALVLLDDNPAERQLVRLELPMVSVPELPEAPEYFPETLLAAGYFESVGFTEEDRQRAEQYQANAARAAVLSTTSDLGYYLESLQMEATIAPFDAIGRGRIAQLINKTNQFNLTARRYTEADVEAFEVDPEVLTLQIRLKDRFGDNGMISVVICVPEQPRCWRIDTWLMSCRVLKRGLEQAILNTIMALARKHGIIKVVGEYQATAKNGMVRDHYERLGFSKLSEDGEAVLWTARVDEFVPTEVAIRVLDMPASATTN